MLDLHADLDDAPTLSSDEVDVVLSQLEDEVMVGPDALAAAVRLHLPSLSEEQRVRLLMVWRRGLRFVESQLVQLIAAVGGPEPTDDDWAREEIALAMQWSPNEAGRHLSAARDMVKWRLMPTRQLLAQGQLSYQHALAIAAATTRLSDEDVSAVEHQVMWHAPEQTVGELRRSLRKAVTTVDGLTADERHRAAVEDRSLQVVPGDDGVAEVVAVNMPADDAQSVFLACDQIARRWRADGDDAGRTLAQMRADALAHMARRELDAPGMTAHGRPVLVNLHMPMATLLGDADEPAELDGYGALPAHLARQLARDAKAWRHLLTDPYDGVVLAAGAVYEPSQALRDRVLARYQTCGIPGCPLPAHRCDLDHNTAFPDGPTCDCNVAPLCRRHHRMRHEFGWHIEHLRDHTLRITTPTNRVYLKRPRGLAPPDQQQRPGPVPPRCPHADHAASAPDADDHAPATVASLSLAQIVDRLRSPLVQLCDEHAAADYDGDPPF